MPLADFLSNLPLAQVAPDSDSIGDIAEYFVALDWIVLFGYLALTTLVGHLMRGKQASIRDFFLGGRNLPWQAVCGSIIATEISGVTFIGVPGMLMAAKGNFTYLQWAIGSFIGRLLVATFFVKAFYAKEIYSPYDYMGERVSRSLKSAATAFFIIGNILGQSVRVLIAALPLRVCTGLSFETCIIIIGVFAVVWTLLGGMRTVIWTDVMQFFLFSLGGSLALIWIIAGLDGGFGEFWTCAKEAGKLQLWDTRFLIADSDGARAFAGELQFTLWVALFAVPFQNLGMFGVDQLNAQRMFCCKDARAASKALIWSNVGQILTLLMLLVGAALFVFYQKNMPTDSSAVGKFLGFDENVTPSVSGDYVFPVWIVSQLPPGLSGLILAGIFAAAISSLDSILAALSQTTLSLFYHPNEKNGKEISQKKLIVISRSLVIFWGIALTAFTFGMEFVKERQNLPVLPLAFGVTAYTVGPLLAFFLAALWGRCRFSGLLIGALLSMALTALVRADFWILAFHFSWAEPQTLAALPTFELNASGDGIRPLYSYVWMWPLATCITLACGFLSELAFGKRSEHTERNERNEHS